MNVEFLPNGCWVWIGRRQKPHGYGLYRQQYTHRIVDRLVRGPRRSEKVLHRCDNPPCLNPFHTFRGTQRENIADMHAKGRGSPPPIFHGDRHVAAKLTAAQAQQMRFAYDSGGCSQRELARFFKVSQRTVNRVVRELSYQYKDGRDYDGR